MSNSPTHQPTRQIQSAVRALSAEVKCLEDWAEAAHSDKSISPAQIGVGLYEIAETHKLLDELTKQLYHVKDFLDKAIMPTRMADFGIDSCRVPEIGRSFSVLEKMSASLIDKGKGYEWLRENGLGDLVQETVNAGTLAAAMRNMILEQGLEPPSDIVKISTYKATSITKYTPKEGITK